MLMLTRERGEDRQLKEQEYIIPTLWRLVAPRFIISVLSRSYRIE